MSDDIDGSLSYVVDDRLRLAGLDRAWDEFAIANGAPELVAPAPIGQPVTKFIADETTAQIYSALFARVASSGRPIAYTIRCDAPTLRRELAMTVSPIDAGFSVRSVVVRAERREPVTLSAASADADDFIKSCGWCKRMDARGRWVEIEEAVQLLALFDRPRLPAMSHGICPTCLRRMEETIG